jgi:hypothetical protein
MLRVCFMLCAKRLPGQIGLVSLFRCMLPPPRLKSTDAPATLIRHLARRIRPAAREKFAQKN